MGNNSSCCSSGCGSGCCTEETQRKQIVIDFLYLDLSVCERCQGTESNLEAAIREVSVVLKAAGYDIQINKVNITTKELATEYQFLSSPTIRINGNDIAMEVKESCCKECGDLCGDQVDCRVWIYEGVEYTQPPKEYIINAILKEVYIEKRASTNVVDYKVPENLEKFFKYSKNKQ